MSRYFIDVYEKLMDDPSLVTRQEALSIENDENRFNSVIVHDLLYKSRKDKNYSFNIRSFLLEKKKKIKMMIRQIKKKKSISNEEKT